MPCYRPLRGYRSNRANPDTGKRSIVFTPKEALDAYEMVILPCGQCIHCKLEKSRQWAMRCVHEAKMFDKNCFLTLTYNDKNLPKHGALDYEAPVLFMKKLRKEFGEGIRSYGCAEYGQECKNCKLSQKLCFRTGCRKWDPQIGRPHYHLALFNHDFEDKELLDGRREHKLYASSTLEDLWGNGVTSIGDLTFESAAYIARYVSKKINGPKSVGHYQRVGRYGELGPELPPERSVCVSRRPGIGKTWYEKYGKYVQEHDFVVMRGQKLRPAKYYDYLFDLEDPATFKGIKENRKIKGEIAEKTLRDEEEQARKDYRAIHGEDAFPTNLPRLYVMEEVHEAKAKKLIRGIE